MNRNEIEKRSPAYYLFTGFAFLLLGIGNLLHLFNVDHYFDLVYGILGIPLMIGSIILLKLYLKNR
ncbi:hypothetical protein ACFYKX_03500 [Cytobacillus sp. FJAT-54145]|uniref:DUF3098 domain-containing protein n=1 Tax=Cytobacillus spartinae TaxID=3299023 RepID=A0ABW6K672_9BACI